MCRNLPAGDDDADAFIAGEEMPTTAAARERKREGVARLAAMSGVDY